MFSRQLASPANQRGMAIVQRAHRGNKNQRAPCARAIFTRRFRRLRQFHVSRREKKPARAQPPLPGLETARRFRGWQPERLCGAGVAAGNEAGAGAEFKQFLLDLGPAAGPVRIRDGEKQRNRKERDAEPDRELAQHMGRLRAEDVLRDSASKRGPKTLAAR